MLVTDSPMNVRAFVFQYQDFGGVTECISYIIVFALSSTSRAIQIPVGADMTLSCEQIAQRLGAENQKVSHE